ncbi:uncharacterized protein GGS25DRAFT_525942 [Hypoxylon fragiforme]|uniref:uncharacterized protein n=1 Tax=Hypoxylon fragiforme TaxID=63214 RepID=UPI0020C6E6D8|nr:uncharacterized protein GGS25DRAFT_525942 [Hypoxylon fragiforme]KAI2602916.1 hypothetical protein GGS25DRAFT_525942 [Hypoxylon fragiforme]
MEIVNWLPLLLPLFAQQVHGDATPVDNGRGAFDAGDYGSHPNQTFVPSCIVAPLFREYGAGSGPLIFRSDDLSLVYANTTWNESINLDV